MRSKTASISEHVAYHLKYDICTRSPSAAVGFAGSALVLFLYPLVNSPERVLAFQISAAIVLAVSLVRWHHAVWILRLSKEAFLKGYRIHQNLIILNAFFVGWLSLISLTDPAATANTLLVAQIILFVYSAASTNSVALAPYLQLIYLTLVLVVPILAMTFTHYSEWESMKIVPLIVPIFIGYVIGSSRQFLKNMISRYEIEEALQIEKSNLVRAIQNQQDAQEEALRQKSRAEYAAKMATIGQMAGTIAHEINSPLTIIHLSAEQMSRSLNSPVIPTEQLHSQISKIQKTTERIAGIIRGLLSLSRDGSRDPFLRFRLDLAMEDTLSFCREKFKNAQIELKLDHFPELEIEGREISLSQVFLNLLTNAFDASCGKKNSWIRVELKDLGTQAEVSVENSGELIAPEIRQKIFAPFFTTKKMGQGTGLGLSISKGIVEDHSGSLEIDEDNKFTRFVVRLPKRHQKTGPV
jgi:signal transduction histidine kinase